MKKILIVDDEKNLLDIMCKFFVVKDYNVEGASDVSKAIDKIRSTHYDVIISDIVMPGKHSGMDVLKAAKKRDSKTEVIMMTGYSSIKNAVESMKLGAYDYIAKPFDFESLNLKMDRIFKVKELEKKHESLRAIEESSYRNIGDLAIALNDNKEKLKKIQKYIDQLLKKISRDSPEYKIVKKIEDEL